MTRISMTTALKFVGVPLGAAALIGAAILLRTSAPPEPPKKAAGSQVRATAVYAPAPLQVAPRPVAPEKIVLPAETVRIRGTYQNYRRAVLTNNEPLKKALLPVLLKDRDAARQCAQEDLERAQTDADRTVAQEIAQELRR